MGDSARGQSDRTSTAVGIEPIVLSSALGDFNDHLRLLGLGALRSGSRVQLTPEDVARFIATRSKAGRGKRVGAAFLAGREGSLTVRNSRIKTRGRRDRDGRKIDQPRCALAMSAAGHPTFRVEMNQGLETEIAWSLYSAELSAATALLFSHRATLP